MIDFRFWISDCGLWDADFRMLDLILFWTGSTGFSGLFLFSFVHVLSVIIFPLIGLAGSHHYANRMQGFDVFADDFNGGRNRD